MDLISREAVSRIKTKLEYDVENALGIPKSTRLFFKRVVSDAFADLPTIQPKKGEWVESCACEMDGALVRSWICSECGNRVYNPFKKYCDECGSKNKSGV